MPEVSARKRIWGWFFFDWASQPFHTLLVTFIFGPYFASIAAAQYLASGLEQDVANAQAQSIWALTITIAGLIIGFGAPLIGAMADTTGRRIPWIAAFSVMYVIGAGSLWFAYPDGSNMILMLVAFAFGFIGAEFALIFINSQLPDLGTQDETGELSGNAFAFGYLGGFIALVLALLLLTEQENGKTLIGLDPLFGFNAAEREGTRAVGLLVAGWYAVFMIPYFMWMRDRPVHRTGGIGRALGQLLALIGSLRHKLSLTTYLFSSMFYRDALNGLYAFGGTYATFVLGWGIVQVGIFGIVAILASVVFCWVCGKVDKMIGPKPIAIACICLLYTSPSPRDS